MKKTPLLLIGAFAASSLSAQTLLDEQFNTGDFTEYGGGNTDLNPNSGGVYRMSLGDSGFTVTNPGGELFLSASSAFGANTAITPYALANPGDSVTLSFDARYTGDTDNGFTLRFGLFETGGITSNGPIGGPAVDGIAAQIGLGATATSSRYGVMNDNTGFSSAPDSFPGSWASGVGSSSTNLAYTMTLNALGGIDISFAQDSTTIAGSVQTIALADVPSFSFDTFAVFVVGNNGANNSLFIDNVLVEAVPEPSAYGLLAGAFALAWVMIRRRG